MVCTKRVLGEGEMIGQFVVKGRWNSYPEPRDRPYNADRESACQASRSWFEEGQMTETSDDVNHAPSRRQDDRQCRETVEAEKSKDGRRNPQQRHSCAES